ncbi:TPA: hypothetical protein I7551_16470 [Vibrio cholerae]|nr:hypothetical protein [Vibrio cholerae]
METIEQVKRTLVQICMLLVFFIPFAIAFQLLPQEGLIAFIVIAILLSPLAVYCAVVNHRERINAKSAWILNTSYKQPRCNLIHVELETSTGKKVLWRQNPNEIDFSDTASDKVLSYLICE